MNNENTTNNPLLCDPETGMCEVPSEHASSPAQKADSASNKSIKILYFTDPICSSCWGIEPQLRKLILEYGAHVEIDYRMGGLLPDWSYNSGGISQPSDVAHHWDEVSAYYDMPIDGDLWLEDPLDSSYPPSISFKAAQLQSPEKAILFLRVLREMVFLKKINIARWEHMASAAKQVALDVDQLRADYKDKAKTLFKEDLQLARTYGVRGFPTVFVMDETGKREIVYGSKAYPFYEMAILKLAPQLVKQEYSKKWEALFEKYPSLTAREFSELSGMPREESDALLHQLSQEGALTTLTTKNGNIWYRISTQA